MSGHAQSVAGELGVAPYPDFTAAARDALEQLHSLTGLDVLVVSRAEPRTDTQWFVAALRSGVPVSVAPASWSGSYCCRMVEGRGPVVAPRCQEVPAYAQAPSNALAPFRAYLGVPLLRGDGQLYGTLCGFSFTDRDDGLAGHLPAFLLAARLLTSLLAAHDSERERAAEAAAARGDAHRDDLTGLANRRGLARSLELELHRAARWGRQTSVAVLDVDGLKALNDTAGHDAGDARLLDVAGTLVRVSRAGDTCARTGGDEFVVLAPGLSPARLRERLVEALAARGLDCSVGVASSAETRAPDQLLKLADTRMYRDKRSRRQRSSAHLPRSEA